MNNTDGAVLVQLEQWMEVVYEGWYEILNKVNMQNILLQRLLKPQQLYPRGQDVPKNEDEELSVNALRDKVTSYDYSTSSGSEARCWAVKKP